MLFSQRSKRNQQPAWRPDFRDPETLPDTKVIRTNFLFNFVAITLMLVGVGLVIHVELSIRAVMAERAALQEQVSGADEQNRALLERNRLWLQYAAPAQEVVRFVATPLDYVHFLTDLAEMRSDGIVFGSIQMGYLNAERNQRDTPPFRIQLTGKITGGADGTPAEIIAHFQQQLREMGDLRDRIIDMSVRQFDRDNDLGVFSFSLEIRIDSSKPKAV